MRPRLRSYEDWDAAHPTDDRLVLENLRACERELLHLGLVLRTKAGDVPEALKSQIRTETAMVSSYCHAARVRSLLPTRKG